MNTKNSTLKTLAVIFTLSVMCISNMHAQVGINTDDPQGALDIRSSVSGMVYPRVALTAGNVAGITQPDGSAIVPGTVVFNTSNTSLGSNDVSPGLHVWDGTQWLFQFLKEDFQKFEQTGGCFRTTIRESYSNPEPSDSDVIPGLDSQVFQPKWSGRYKVEVKTNFSAGNIDPFTPNSPISLATAEGAFFLTMSGAGIDLDPSSSYFDYNEGWIYTHSYGSVNTLPNPDIYNSVPHYGVVVYYFYLMENSSYTFTLTNCMNTGDNYFVNNGDSGTGQGHVGHEIPCSVEFTYLGE